MKEMPYNPKIKEMIYDPSIIKKVVLLNSGTFEGFEYYIINCDGEYPVAYIKVPDDLKISCENPFEIDLDSPHGGLTFCCENDVPPRLEGIASKGNYLGWDYAHYGDYVSYYGDKSVCFMKKWTTEEILDQVKNTIEELKNAQLLYSSECNLRNGIFDTKLKALKWWIWKWLE